jgi:CHAT domain-containing protein
MGPTCYSFSLPVLGIDPPEGIAETISGQSQPEVTLQTEARASVRGKTASTLLESADERRKSGVAGDLAEAVTRYEAACKLWREIYARQQLAITLLHLGATLRDLHSDERASKSLSEALELSSDLSDDSIKAESLMLLGMLQMRRGDLHGALAQVKQAFSISRELGNQRLESSGALFLAEIQFNAGNMQEAADYAQSSFDISKRESDQKGIVRAAFTLGYINTATQSNEKARTLLVRAVSLAVELNDLPGVVDAMTMLGHQYSATGEKQRALETYLNADSYADRLQDPERQGRLFAGMDFVYEELGNVAMSLEYCRRSISLYHASGYSVGEFERYERLGKLQFQTGDYAHALENYQSALAFFRKAGMKNFVYYVLSEMGEVYEAMNRDDKALDYYAQARQLIGVEEDPREYSYVLNRIGHLTERLKGPTSALDLYNAALKLNRKAGDLFGEAATLLSIARAQKELGHAAEARSSIEAALHIDERIRDELAVSDLRASYFGTVNQHFDFFIELLMEARGEGSVSNVLKALEISEGKRARSLLDEVAARNVRVNGNKASRPLLERERNLKAKIDQKRDEYAKLKLNGKMSSRSADVADELLRLSEEYDQVLALKSQDGAQTKTSSQTSLTAREIQGVIDDQDTLLLEYSLGDEHSYLWAVTQKDIESYQLPKRSEIESDVLELIRAIKAMTPQQSSGHQPAVDRFSRQTTKLSTVLLQPVSARLAQAKRIVIVADGALQYVPFGALPTPELKSVVGDSGSYDKKSGAMAASLLATHEISFLPSVSVLIASHQRSRNRPAPTKTVVVIADPVFSRDDDRIHRDRGKEKAAAQPSRARGSRRVLEEATNGGTAFGVESKRFSSEALLSQVLRDMDTGAGGLPRLFATQFEAQGILLLSDPAQSFAALNFDASRDLLRSETLRNYRIIHIATHGFFDNEHPELSGVVLSMYDEKGRSQNGLVQLRDIYDLNLNADIVVLSACQTGLGKEVKGEGLTGLARAFMFAGARRVVASLWKVDDEATAELMTNFYRHLLKENMTPSAALRAAQLEIAAQARWRQPFYWAGLVITGDFR